MNYAHILHVIKPLLMLSVQCDPIVDLDFILSHLFEMAPSGKFKIFVLHLFYSLNIYPVMRKKMIDNRLLVNVLLVESF